jgi:hypothetical protein
MKPGSYRPRRLAVQRDICTTIAAVNPPTSPTVAPHEDQVRGLALFDAGLHLTHVQRVSESLAYSDRFSMARSVSADVDLSLLMPNARATLQQPQRARADLPATLWIPIARHGRTELSGVDVSLNNGDLLPGCHNGTALTCWSSRSFASCG